MMMLMEVMSRMKHLAALWGLLLVLLVGTGVESRAVSDKGGGGSEIYKH